VSIREMFGLNCRGKRIAREDPNHPIAEFRVRVALSNRFKALGKAEMFRMAKT
jgi:hypothetical protein